MTEAWKPILGYEGSYSVSDQGRVRSEARVVPNSGNPSGFVTVPERILRGTPDAYGYVAVHLRLLGKRQTAKVHRLVAVAFIPGDTSLDVNHRDFDRTNNRVSNLEWLTSANNHTHATSAGRRQSCNGADNHNRKLHQLDVILILRALAACETQTAIAARFGVSKSNISKIASGENWRDLPARSPEPDPNWHLGAPDKSPETISDRKAAMAERMTLPNKDT